MKLIPFVHYNPKKWTVPIHPDLGVNRDALLNPFCSIPVISPRDGRVLFLCLGAKGLTLYSDSLGHKAPENPFLDDRRHHDLWNGGHFVFFSATPNHVTPCLTFSSISSLLMDGFSSNLCQRMANMISYNLIPRNGSPSQNPSLYNTIC